MRAPLMRLLAVATLCVAASCDSGVTPPAPTPSSNSASRLLLGSPTTVHVVTRNTPLAAPLSASATIGILGGQISLPGTGLKVTVPPLAVRAGTRITVTALVGNQVAYEFEPHGIQFLTPVLLSQNLTGTSAANSNGLIGGLLSSSLVGGYFTNKSDLNPGAGTGLVSELLSVVLNLSTKTATFPVFHFSGYLVATGESSFDASGAVNGR